MDGADRHPRAHPYEPARAFEEGSEEHIATITKYKRHSMFSSKEWLFESLSIIAALSCLVGIAVIFFQMHNKPLTAWRTRIPSLSATISILTTASAAAIMYSVSAFVGQYKWIYFKEKPRELADFGKIDDVSRSTFGSLKWLVTTKPNIATLGAIITILQLTFTPFAQQVISIKQRDIATPASSASFGYAHSYNHLDKSDTPSGLANAAIESYPQDPDMQTAIIQGLSGITLPEPYRCPGACIWKEKYVSLGFKSECKNVTQVTLKTATCEGPEYFQTCTLTTPGGVDLVIRFAFTDSATAYYLNVSAPMLSPTIPSQLSNLPVITRFAIFRSTPDDTYLMNDIRITECSLSLAAYEYSHARANGSGISFANRHEVNFGAENPWQLPHDRMSSIHTNESTSGDVQIPMLEMSFLSLMSLRNFFMSTTIVSEWVAGSYKNRNLGLSSVLSVNVNISERFERMAAAMTDRVRYGPNSLSAHGDLMLSEAYVYIHWWYFIVPAAAELLAIVFAVLTIVRNRKSRGVPLWKNSAIAVLECQLQKHDEQYGLLQSSGMSIDELNKQAEEVEVALR
ncbi:hypothetical protein N7452_010958 [Penicillium brevicompactum]|uniref:Uncharacterized protein n=1 Tax=Penicillium brevicompactum TaxID=5074 RepID=A0A9W9U8L9_PENBR|nr:hypothetical protein N7452_010958 [Penicillium brevicompactum]